MSTLVAEQTIQVNERDFDVDTNLDIRTGDRLVISASGEIWAGVWLTGRNGPDGWNNIDLNPKFPLVCSHPYCLLGRLDGRYFFAGSGIERVYTGRDSRLFLRINDDAPGNGNGAFTAHIEVYRDAPTRSQAIPVAKSAGA